MANFDAQIQALSGTATQTEMDDWAADAVKEIINILPLELKQKCSKVTNLYIGNTDTIMDLDGTGEILYVTRENANSGYYIGCREISPILADSANDSTSLNYATATDPVYWTESNSSGNPTLFVKPTPDTNQPAKIYHISYPTVDVSAVSAIVNFPDEAEYLVVLYVAVKVLQNKMNEMNASIIHSDQDGSYSATSSSSQGWDKVRDWLETEEDSEMSQATAQALSAEMQQFIAEYQWYQGQQVKLQQDYDKGIAMLVNQGIPKPQQGAK